MGGDANGVLFKDWAFQQWTDKYGVKAPWGPKEFTHLAVARKRLETEELARAAWTTFLNCTEAFYEGHSPSKFVMDPSKWAAKMPKPKPARSFPGAARAAAMAAVAREVSLDATIPESKKQDEMKKRWSEIPLDS